ncbi:TPM domain-containing protein [Corynebacterium sphenisci]|uniref:TPM domain-containing protein n=1 Tax=Corynebacterium sphenisci TaxID=191493 RepID=UPI0026E0504C|nr:TPM domain-containing protein [Corynebacterium sphenisci]MDO5731630.1 TPM domain-containing protein [Corynebacterium sphenisci]
MILPAHRPDRPRRGRRLAAALACGAALALPVAGFAGLAAAPPAVAEAPRQSPDPLVDDAGVLSAGEARRIADRLTAVQADTGTKLYVIFVRSFDGLGAERWAAEALTAQGGADNMAVAAIAVQDRLIGAYAGPDASVSGPELNEAVRDVLAGSGADPDWAAAADAAVDAADGGGGIGAGVALGGLAAAGAIGGGAVAWSSRRRKRRLAGELAAARGIRPGDVAALDAQSTEVLQGLAAEELTSTDQSVRTAADELELARAEFGAERVSDLERALAHSRSTLDRAFRLHESLSGAELDEATRRATLLEIISTCGSADEALDARAADYREMRAQLMNAGDALDGLTRRCIDARTRMEAARATLAALRERHPAETLASVDDNVDIAAAHIAEAEQAVGRARPMLALPAGEQGGIVDAIHDAQVSLAQVDRLLEAVEHADARIAQAGRGLPALIDEVAAEVEEGRRLLDAGALGLDEAALSAAMAEGAAAVDAARAGGDADPLGAWTRLTEADAALDERLDSARDAADRHRRTTATLGAAIREARTRVDAAQALIGTRGRIVGGDARALLHEAQRLLDSAVSAAAAIDAGRVPAGEELLWPRRAIGQAREAAKKARAAEQRARRDIEEHRQRTAYRGGGGFGGGGGGGFTGGSSGF